MRVLHRKWSFWCSAHWIKRKIDYRFRRRLTSTNIIIAVYLAYTSGTVSGYFDKPLAYTCINVVIFVYAYGLT